MKNQPYLVPGIIALLLALFMTVRVTCIKSHFDHTVREAYKSSEGYDQLFIDMVKRLEEVLATRAQFGYSGGKDPMTGQVRSVVRRRPVRTRGRKPTGAASDPFKLTAIIFDDRTNKYTAIVMDGERSFSVERGDVIAGRKVRKITKTGILMESKTHVYLYDIYGKIKSKRK